MPDEVFMSILLLGRSNTVVLTPQDYIYIEPSRVFDTLSVTFMTTRPSQERVDLALSRTKKQITYKV
ncbi:hypothetical protein HYW60_04035 [Candidatus Kaiserbacteria bacterium]|nr:hypothetical protein [Candidatus Kaiserbacteria bacterium]